MNRFIVGLGDQTPHLRTKQGFLLIDGGAIANHFLQSFKRAVVFDPHVHRFNPLPMNDVQAQEFADIVFGEEGAGTLTVRNGKDALIDLLMKAKRLDNLGAGRSDAHKEAQAAIDRLLRSPLLRKILCGTDDNRFSFRRGRSIVARLDPTDPALGRHNAKILAALLIFQFKGQVIIPDFGRYARVFHTTLADEKRLMAGVKTLSQIRKRNYEELLDTCLLMERIGTRCTYDDAVELAKYDCDEPPRTDGYDTFIKRAMGRLGER